MREKDADKLIGQFYDGILQPENWFQAAEALRGLFDASVAHILCWDAEHSVDRLAVVTEYGLSLRHDYGQHFGQIDPRLRHASHAPVGEIFVCHEHFSESFVQHDEFYQDFLLPRVGRYSIGTTVMRNPEYEVQLGITRAADAGKFGVSEQHVLAGLLPHLEKALSLTLAAAREKARCALNSVAMDVSHFGMVALSAEGVVLFANQRAETTLRLGKALRVKDGQLRAMVLADDRQLHEAIRLVATTRLPRNLTLGEIGCQLSVTLIAGSESSASAGFFFCTDVIAIMTEQGCKRLATVRQLMEFFGYTPAEARLARGLAQGESLESYADAQGVKRTTVRTQLQSVLSKSGVGTQKDLVRLIHELPPVRD